ncbi:cytochrome c oxidase subunit II [Pedobacter sp. SYP-B3415]|uniref:cytochrome c oxidase subunit II n=1 Tax=Pedobacter sp. SYP-B3415 TaxID=2496641 RepID=UPI00101CA5CF|nr:cytochrome c oxidase subunit II [Pedobacter sp. SYP-B3415]
MSLIKVIGNKKTVVLTALSTAFASASVFAQEAAVSATTTANTPEAKVDMDAVYKSVIFYSLIFLSFCLFVAIVGRAIKVYELTREVQGKPAAINWNKVNASLFALFLLIGLYGVYWEYTVHGSMLLPDASSEHGRKIDEMFNLTLIITTIVFIATHIALFAFAYFYKHSAKRKAYFYPHNNTIEKIWTIAPALVLTVLVLMGFLTWRSIFYKTEDPNNKALQVEVISEQFAWQIRYPGADGIVGDRNYKLTTGANVLGIDFKDKRSRDDQMADELWLPVNKPVKVILGSKDVIHSFYLPHFRVQLNTVPGMRTYFEFTPTATTQQMREKLNDPSFEYVLLCSKICGQGHYNMQKRVRVVTEEEYAEWIKQQPQWLNDDLRKAFNLPVSATPAAAPAAAADTTAQDSMKVNPQAPTI